MTVLRPIEEISRSCSLSDSMLVQSVSTMVSTWYSFTLLTRGPRLQAQHTSHTYASSNPIHALLWGSACACVNLLPFNSKVLNFSIFILQQLENHLHNLRTRESTKQWTHQLTNQSTNQWTHQSTNQDVWSLAQLTWTVLVQSDNMTYNICIRTYNMTNNIWIQHTSKGLWSVDPRACLFCLMLSILSSGNSKSRGHPL